MINSSFRTYKDFLGKSFKVTGRIERSKFWYSVLVGIFALSLLYTFMVLLGLAPLTLDSPIELLRRGIYLSILAVIALHLIAFHTMGIRRWRDVTGNGWNFLWGYIPIAGGVLTIWTFCRRSNAWARRR